MQIYVCSGNAFVAAHVLNPNVRYGPFVVCWCGADLFLGDESVRAAFILGGGPAVRTIFQEEKQRFRRNRSEVP